MRGMLPVFLIGGGLLLFVIYKRRTTARAVAPTATPVQAAGRAVGSALAGIPPAATAAIGGALGLATTAVTAPVGAAFGILGGAAKTAGSFASSAIHTVSFGLF